MAFRLSTLVVGVAIAALGCQSLQSPSQHDPSASESGTSSPALGELADAVCEIRSRCCGAVREGCEEISRALVVGFGPVFESEVADGGVQLDQLRTERCLAVLRTRSCAAPTVFFAVPECAAIIRGTRGRGESCAEFVGCQSGLSCIFGRCEDSREVAESCDAGVVECASGWCRDRACSHGAVCVGGTCQLWKSVGNPCDPLKSAECYPATHYCGCPDGGTCSVGVCLARARFGASCSRPRECVSLSCAGGLCTAAVDDVSCE